MDNLHQHSDKPTFESVWALFQETDRKFQETQRVLDKKFQDTDRKFQETREQFQESQRELKLRDKQFTKRMNKLEDLFKGQWGKLVESLVEGDLINLLNQKEIKVNETATRVRGIHKGKEYEFDIIAENGEEIVVVEVKSTLGVDDVKSFLSKLETFKEVKPKYEDKIIYGAVAYLNLSGEADKYAYRNGLYVIKATGNSAKITNDEDFKADTW
jgi:Holliday junction resolvase-like predicted endonuclease